MSFEATAGLEVIDLLEMTQDLINEINEISIDTQKETSIKEL